MKDKSESRKDSVKRIKSSNEQVKAKLSLLVMLVVMIFTILLMSSAIAGFISYILVTHNIIPLRHGQVIEAATVYMALVSLLIGTILASFFGSRFLRPIRELADATKAVAAGDFSVRLGRGRAKEIDFLKTSFNDMVSELSSIETLRSDFVSNISHEFKTPVASIRGFAGRLKKNSLTQEQRDEYLDIIISESERLTRLSSNVLLLSSLENTDEIHERMQYQLDEQLRRTVLLMEPQLLRKNLEVDISLKSVSVTANEEMLSDLWINLFSNAIKFSPQDATITLNLQSTQADAIVTISDQGIGMSEEVKKHIFDKFYQGDKSRSSEGNGLGLPLVKRILELENGKIDVDSQPDKGATFTVSLPLNK